MSKDFVLHWQRSSRSFTVRQKNGDRTIIADEIVSFDEALDVCTAAQLDVDRRRRAEREQLANHFKAQVLNRRPKLSRYNAGWR